MDTETIIGLRELGRRCLTIILEGYDLTVTKVGLADEAFQDIPGITLRSGTVNL